MVVVSIIDKTAQKHKKRVTSVARFLMRKYKKGHFNLDISLVGDALMKKNVLAYPATSFPRPDLKQPTLGEIILNPAFISREPLEIGNWKLEIPAKLDYMLIHGFLHLLGYDHKKKNDTIMMEKLEQQLLKELEGR